MNEIARSRIHVEWIPQKDPGGEALAYSKYCKANGNWEAVEEKLDGLRKASFRLLEMMNSMTYLDMTFVDEELDKL